jgi:heptosyltransferase III
MLRTGRTRGNALLRRLDSVVGIPAVAVTGLLPRRRMPPAADIRRIGLMKTAAIGDTMLLAGVVDDIAAAYPGATVVLVTGRDNAAAGQLLGSAVGESVVINPASPVRALAAVRAARLDLLLDFGSWPRFDALVTALSGARYRVGFVTPGQHRGGAYDAAVPHLATVHERHNYQRLAGAIGVTCHSPPSIAVQQPVTPPTGTDNGYAIFHPWAGGFMHQRKEWAADRWVALGQHMAARGWTVVLSGSAADAPRSTALAGLLRSAAVGVVDVAGRYSLAEFAALAQAARVVVSVNTGAMHVAALAGAPTVSLEGPVPVHRWGPLGPRVRSVVAEGAGCGYLNLGFEYAGRRDDCMDAVAVPAVVGAIDQLLGRSAAR